MTLGHVPEPTRKADVSWCNDCHAIWPCDAVRWKVAAIDLADALARLTCRRDGTFNDLRENFEDGQDIVLSWPGNLRDWKSAKAALSSYRGLKNR